MCFLAKVDQLATTAILLAEHRKSKRYDQIAGHCQHGARGAPGCPREQGTARDKRTILALSATSYSKGKEQLPASNPTIQMLLYQIHNAEMYSKVTGTWTS